MFEIEIDRTFSAAHQLKGYPGACCNMHGHNYALTVTVGAEKLNEIGIALDFKTLKAAVDKVVIEPYDHHNLSELPEFQAVNPSSEILAQTIYRKLCAELNKDGVRVLRVTVGESAGSRVSYCE